MYGGNRRKKKIIKKKKKKKQRRGVPILVWTLENTYKESQSIVINIKGFLINVGILNTT